MKKVTPWFPPSVKPIRKGVYEREFSAIRGKREVAYSYWSGRRWFWRASTAAMAESRADQSFDWTSSLMVPWRGLAEDPKKGANK